jgi:hypothetical protein
MNAQDQLNDCAKGLDELGKVLTPHLLAGISNTLRMGNIPIHQLASADSKTRRLSATLNRIDAIIAEVQGRA